jgi:hypothetical protein
MNIAAMAAASDIADWCLEELALPGMARGAGVYADTTLYI